MKGGERIQIDQDDKNDNLFHFNRDLQNAFKSPIQEHKKRVLPTSILKESVEKKRTIKTTKTKKLYVKLNNLLNNEEKITRLKNYLSGAIAKSDIFFCSKTKKGNFIEKNNQKV